MIRKYVSVYVLGFLFLTLGASEAMAQTERTNQSEGSQLSQTFYVEALGPGLIVSANYDTRFMRGNPGGWGGRVGIGYFAAGDISFVSVPLQVNYLLGGKGGHYFEVGGGLTYASGRISFSDDNGERGHDVAGALAFGYRLQPIGGGFNFRAGLSPMFGKGYFVPYWPHLSFGYTF